ncbi:uncharacterized protein [Dysidea avara]|uniref:uncharacterized protein n=1 Tax=Dysidea avara TaxID=196820 RepID=UPI00331ABE9D
MMPSHTTHAGDSSHSSDSPFDHLIDAYYHLEHSFLHIIDALRKFIHYNDQKSVKLKPFYHQYVRVCYHGPKPTTTFSVTLEENIDYITFPSFLMAGSLIVWFAPQVSRNVDFLYGVIVKAVGITILPFIHAFIVSTKIRQVFLSYGILAILVLGVGYWYRFIVMEVDLFHFVTLGSFTALTEITYFKGINIFVRGCRSVLKEVHFFWLIRTIGGIILVFSTQLWATSFLIVAVMCIAAYLYNGRQL